MNQRSKKFYDIVEDFKVTRSYAKTGRNFGVSRQRVDQIIKESGINIKAKRSHHSWVGSKCANPNCRKVLTIGDYKAGYCWNCYYRFQRIKRMNRKKLIESKEVSAK